MADKLGHTLMPDSQFEYWFTRLSDHEWIVAENDKSESNREWAFDERTNQVIGIASSDKVQLCDNGQSETLDDRQSETLDIHRIKSDFTNFKVSRPEYLIGVKPILSSMSSEEKQEWYDALFVGCMLCRVRRNNPASNIDDAADKALKILSRLHKTSFYQDPASTIYHESYPGGLLNHTLTVVNEIIDLHKVTKFNRVPYDTAVLAALVHDWCKIGLYEGYQRNVKNEKTGAWEKVDAYRRTDPPVPLGHGAASLHLVQQYLRLSLEECLAIRWHMGEYNVAPNEMNELHCANERYPLVQMLQFADRLAIVNY